MCVLHQSVVCMLIFLIWRVDRGYWASPGGASGKESACQCRRHEGHGSIPGSERSPGGGHENLYQDSCLENPMGRGA